MKKGVVERTIKKKFGISHKVFKYLNEYAFRMGEDISLKGNIVLSGFSEFDRAEISIIKKMVGSYARKLTDSFGVDELKVTLKSVHKIEKAEKFEITASAIKDKKTVSSEVTDKNLYFALDSSLKKVENQLS